jgi:hypothetical protein
MAVIAFQPRWVATPRAEQERYGFFGAAPT